MDNRTRGTVNFHQSPSRALFNDSANRINSSGTMDYYNKEGEFLGNDGRTNDNNFMVLLDGRDVKTVRERYFGSGWNRHKGEILGTVVGAIVGALAGLLVLGVLLAALLGAVIGYLVGRFILKDKFLKKHPTSATEIAGTSLQPPSEQVRREIRAALERSNQPTLANNARVGFVADAAGGFHEEGGVWGIGPDSSEVIGRAMPGTFSDPSTGGHATISLNTLVTPMTAQTVGTFHIHPKGERKIERAERTPGTTSTSEQYELFTFDQAPSGRDFAASSINQQSSVYEYDIVVGARSAEVYFYRDTNSLADPYLAKISTSRFFKGLR